MNVLAIGNSFSDDALYYLHAVAARQNVQIEAETLYVGGCSLEQHCSFLCEEKAAYELISNGVNTKRFISLKEALMNRKWDVITVQQASHFSFDYNTYQPYLNRLVEFVRMSQPSARIYAHETWAYEDGSDRLFKTAGFATHKEMYRAIAAAYSSAVIDAKLDGLIPCGKVFDSLMDSNIKCHRDTFHASFGLGRYALALTWLMKLTGADIQTNDFAGFDEPVDAADILLLKQVVKNSVLSS